MSDNVIILGAGASKDAGIPLLAGFVEKMLDFHQKGINKSEPLSGEDKTVFQNAIDVIDELDGYHGRAAFDGRNIEDILSILSFEVMGGEEPQRTKWNAMIKAIARTIELTCIVKHDGGVPEKADLGLTPYTNFWARLFQRFASGRSLPSIINFNYDLVLERTLFQLLNNCEYGPNSSITRRGNFPFEGINLKYHYESVENYAYLVQPCNYQYMSYGNPVTGTMLVPSALGETKKAVEIEMLKLHGSLNFPTSAEGFDKSRSPTIPVSDPFILPPIFNKLSMKDAAPMWKIALLRLRHAKKVFIVGYSLPRTDIYMQYFFKTALGPNRDLRKIVVFNPALFHEGQEGENMKKRYGECFAPQFQGLIEFQPRWHWISSRNNPTLGTFQHFSEAVERDNELFF